jgi:hypothetical protein
VNKEEKKAKTPKYKKISKKSILTSPSKKKIDYSDDSFSNSIEENNKKRQIQSPNRSKVNFNVKNEISQKKKINYKTNSHKNEDSFHIERLNTTTVKRSKSSISKNIKNNNSQKSKTRIPTPTYYNKKSKKYYYSKIMNKTFYNPKRKNIDFEINDHNKFYNNNIDNEENNRNKIINKNFSQYNSDGEEFEIELSNSDNKMSSLERVNNKDESKQFEYIKPIKQKDNNNYYSSSQNSRKSTDKIKDLNSSGLHLKKIIDKQSFSLSNQNNSNFFLDKIERKNSNSIDNNKKLKKIDKTNLHYKFFSNDYNYSPFQNSERITMEQYLKSPMNKKINLNNIKYNINHFQNNSISSFTPRINNNYLIPENINYIPINLNKEDIYSNRPKDYDPDFNFNLIKLEFNNKNNSNGLFYNNIKYDFDLKNEFNNIVRNCNKRFNSNSSINFNNNFSRIALNNNSQREYIDDYYGTKPKNKNFNFNNIFPQKKKIKFIKIGKTNFQEE